MDSILNNIRIRQATKQDDAPLWEFMTEHNYYEGGDRIKPMARDYLDAAFSDEYRKPTFLVGMDGDTIVACGAYTEEYFTVDVWGISWVTVAPEYRRKGIGTKITAALCDHIREAAGKDVTILLNTYPGKTKLYERCGFEGGGQDHCGGTFMVKHVKAA